MKLSLKQTLAFFIPLALAALLSACVKPGDAYYPSFPYQLSRMNDGVDRDRYHMWISEDDGAIVTLPPHARSLSGDWSKATLTFANTADPIVMRNWIAELCMRAKLQSNITLPVAAKGLGNPAGSQKILFTCH